MHLPPITRFFVRWIIRLSMLVLFVGVPAAIFYLRQVGVSGELKQQVAAALSGDKFHTSIGRLLFDPFKGLIAEDVEVTEPGSSRRLAQIERLVVSIALGDLLQRKVTVDFIEFDDTEVSVPLGSDPDSPRVNLEDVNAQCSLLGGQLRLSYFDARVAGMHVILSGLLQNPQAFHLESSSSQGPSTPHHETIQDVLEQLAALHFPGQPPEFRAEINGDLADLSTLRVAPISFRSGPVVGKNWRIEGIDANAQYLDGVWTLSQLSIRAEEGALTASAQMKDRVLEFEVSSSVRPTPFLNGLPKDSALKSLQFQDAPQIDAFGSVDLSASPAAVSVTGNLSCGQFSYRGVKADAFSADFVWKEGRIFARGARLRAGGGELVSDVLFSPGDFRLRLSNSIAPTVFTPIFGEKEQAFLKQMEFKDRPLLKVEVQGTSPNFADITGEGTLHLGRTAIRNSWLDKGDTKIQIADKAVTYRDFTINVGKGVGTGTFVYDFGGQQVRLQNINSTLVPVDVLMWIDPKIAEALKPYRFREAPKVKADGMVHLKDPRKNNLSLKVQSAEGLDYDLLKKTLRFGRTTADVGVIGTKVNANVTSAQLMGGDVSMKAIVSIDASDPTFGANVTVRRVDFAKLTKLYFNYDDSKGVMTGNYNFTARGGQEEKMRGSGSIKVEDGHVFAIPVLGPLSDIINKIIPGSGYQTAREATADFRVADEKISTDNLVIEGAGFSLYGHGNIAFMKDQMDLSVRINARGIPGIVLFPVSKLFEYVATGSVSKPEWRPKIIPRIGGGGE